MDANEFADKEALRRAGRMFANVSEAIDSKVDVMVWRSLSDEQLNKLFKQADSELERRKKVKAVIPKQTWGEALKEKLPSEVYDLVAGYMGEEKLRMEFSSWNNLGLFYSFVNSKEGFTYHLNIVKFCNNDLDTCPFPPKPELRIMTTIELAGKYLIKEGDWWMVNICNEEIKRYHNNGYKWADHPSSEQFSLMVEV